MKELDKLQKELEKQIAESISASKLTPIAKKVSQDVKDRTRQGKGVSQDGGTEQPLKELSDSYKAQRARLKQLGKLSPDTNPDTSNLTQKGGMLDTLSGTARNGSIEVSVSTQNQKKAQHVDAGGRPFMHLSADEISDLEKSVSDSIESELNKHFKG